LGFAPRPFDRLAFIEDERARAGLLQLAEVTNRRQAFLKSAGGGSIPLYHDPKAVFTDRAAFAALPV
jgi:hypothetical protein